MKEFDAKVVKDSILIAKNIRGFVLNDMGKTEQFTIGSQMLRSSLSISSNITEGFGRNTKPQIVQFLNIAHGSCCELISQLMVLDNEPATAESRYGGKYELSKYIEEGKKIKEQIRKLIQYYNKKSN